MLNVKNISTGEVKVVYRVHFNNANNVFTFEGVPSEKVLAKMEGIFTYDGNNDEQKALPYSLTFRTCADADYIKQEARKWVREMVNKKKAKR